MCHTDTLVHPIDDEDNAIALIRFESGAIGQFEVSWTFRGGMDLRDEVAGTHGTIWLNHFLRTGFEMFTRRRSGRLRGREGRDERPAGCSRSATRSRELGLRGHVHRHVQRHRRAARAPQETFYDGYVVNAVMDACYRSAKSGAWEPVELDWRGGTTPRITASGEELRGPRRHQARAPAGRPREDDPQGDGDGELRRPHHRRRVSPSEPPPYRLEVLPAGEWAGIVAGWFGARLLDRPTLRVCLPTGDTPSPVYAELVAAEWRGDVSLAAATVMLLDEWVGLSPDDPARCDARLRDEVIGQLAAPPAFVPIDVDGQDPETAARAHDAEVAPGLDLAVLGLGMNGHVGFNEPGSRPDDGTRLVRLAVSSRDAATARYGAGSVPTAGITVGLSRLLEAGECWLLVTGERKAAILRRTLEEPEGPECPASYLLRHPRLSVFADEAAASLLRRG